MNISQIINAYHFLHPEGKGEVDRHHQLNGNCYMNPKSDLAGKFSIREVPGEPKTPEEKAQQSPGRAERQGGSVATGTGLLAALGYSE